MFFVLCALAMACPEALRAQALDAAPSAAAARPRIGLVLSGGGARGAAHIGVLKLLEQQRIPIDAIAGTSMGAVVGGLYASGLSAREIEGIMTSVDWQDAFRDRPPRADLNFRRKAEDQEFLVKFPLGLKGGDFRLPKGLIQGQKLQQLLRRLTLPVATIERFDDLPVRFRAVATDLETGDAVVLDRGDLAQALRASASAPGVFAPVETGGRVLVDGGIAENLPIDVARSMGVDVLIVVDVGFPLLPRARLNSAPTISNQTLAIFVRRNANLQKRTLTDADVLIEPPLGEASSFDFSRVASSVSIGETAARAASARLAGLALDADAYADWLALRGRGRSAAPSIDYVRVADDSLRYQRALQGVFGDLVGAPLDADRAGARVSSLYGQGNLELLDYRLERDGERSGLLLEARRNSFGPNYIRFGLSLQDDFEGNSSFNAAARIALTELTARGAEWVWDFQVGETPRIATELFVPLDYGTRYFVAPQARFELRNVAQLSGQRRIGEYRVRSFEYGVDFGRQFGNWGEIRAGLSRETGSSKVRIGDITIAPVDFDVREYFTRLTYDRLDDVNFPRRGQSFSIEWRGERSDLGSSRNADLVRLNWLAAMSRGRDTGVLWFSGGSNLDATSTSVRTLFPLGGFLNLSGLAPESLSGRHYAIARALYYRKVGRGGEGFLNVPAYVGVSFELGNVWDQRSDISLSSARRNGSVFLGLDTLFGPVYLGAGLAEGGATALYLFLGRTF
jgi:NTE family protein